jgi:hypothetical protein
LTPEPVFFSVLLFFLQIQWRDKSGVNEQNVVITFIPKKNNGDCYNNCMNISLILYDSIPLIFVFIYLQKSKKHRAKKKKKLPFINNTYHYLCASHSFYGDRIDSIG